MNVEIGRQKQNNEATQFHFWEYIIGARHLYWILTSPSFAVYECYAKSQPLSYGWSNLIHGCIQRAERQSGGWREGREGAVGR